MSQRWQCAPLGEGWKGWQWLDGYCVSLLVVVGLCRRGQGLTLGALLDAEPQL